MTYTLRLSVAEFETHNSAVPPSTAGRFGLKCRSVGACKPDEVPSRTVIDAAAVPSAGAHVREQLHVKTRTKVIGHVYHGGGKQHVSVDV